MWQMQFCSGLVVINPVVLSASSCWHLQVLNRSPQDLKKNTTSQELDQKEKFFFSTHPDLDAMPSECKGLSALVAKLAQVQGRRIADFVPEFKAQVSFWLLA